MDRVLGLFFIFTTLWCTLRAKTAFWLILYHWIVLRTFVLDELSISSLLKSIILLTLVINLLHRLLFFHYKYLTVNRDSKQLKKTLAAQLFTNSHGCVKDCFVACPIESECVRVTVIIDGDSYSTFKQSVQDMWDFGGGPTIASKIEPGIKCSPISLEGINLAFLDVSTRILWTFSF